MASFNDTLHFITSIKLQELEKQRLAYQEHARVLEEIPDSPIERVEKLYEAVESWRGPGATAYNTVIDGRLRMDARFR